MLTRFKKLDGAHSSIDNGTPKRGNKGRLSLFAERNGEGFTLQCVDVGNYGTERWRGNFGVLSEEDIMNMISDLTSLVRSDIQTTEIELTTEDTEEVETVSVEEVEEDVPVTAPLVDSDTQSTVPGIV